MSIIGHIDLFSPTLKIPTYLLNLDQKVLPTMGIVFPHHPLLQWGWMENSVHLHSLETISDLGEYMCMTPPKYSIYGHPKVKADQLTWRECQGWSADLVWSSRPYPYMEKNGHLKVKDGHLTLLAYLPRSPQSGLKFGWSNIKSMSVYLACFIFQN